MLKFLIKYKVGV